MNVRAFLARNASGFALLALLAFVAAALLFAERLTGSDIPKPSPSGATPGDVVCVDGKCRIVPRGMK